jgi:hypothetical protein
MVRAKCTTALGLLFGLLVGTGCGADAPTATPPEKCSDDECDTDEGAVTKPDAGKPAKPGKPDAKVAEDAGGPAVPASDAAAPVDTGKGAGGGVPCEVAAVVSKHCASCHGEDQKFGAPRALVAAADFRAQSKLETGKSLTAVIPTRFAPSDTNRRMPPTSKPAMTADEQKTLKTWLEQGAKAASPGCAIEAPADAPVTAGGKGGSGGASTMPIEYDDPEMECYKLTTFANGNKAKKYTVAAGTRDAYVNFYMKAPWEGVRYTRAVKVLTDNDKVIHHWLLFNNKSPQRDGQVSPGSGTHGADEELLYGWAPGATPLYLDPDVGQLIEGGSGFTLEAHYNNTGAAGDDASGAELCVTTKVPAHVAGLSWVGSDSIAGTSANGTCRPKSQEIHLIAAQPHMHLKGKHMKVVINRAGGMKETLHDEDFSFENQRYYVLNSVLQPGDTMSTTCSYSSAATFGQSTMQEMCYFFSLHWPAGALTGGTGGLLHGGYSCL